MHFRWNRAIQHGFQISPYRGQRGTEIVGYIGYKLFLIILGTGNFACHIIQTRSQITDFILTIHLKFIMHITGSILLCGMSNLPQRNIYDLSEKDQNDQG